MLPDGFRIENDTLFWPCGCHWAIVGDPPAPDALPLVAIDENHLPHCPATYNELAYGFSRGVFQLEKQLGQQWCRTLKPEHEEHLSALGALLRPGCLRSKDENGISITEMYCKRKNGEMPVTYPHPKLERHLAQSYGLMIYQEQFLAICAELAGLDLVAQDKARKGVGKKIQEEIRKVRDMFLQGCAKMGEVSDETAKSIWHMMESSGRYLFNKSHSQSYALLSYDTAYIKAHLPVQFIASWLRHCRHEQKPLHKVAELVMEARRMQVPVLCPDVRRMRALTHTDGARVWFGLDDVKGVGAAALTGLRQRVAELTPRLGPVSDWTWEVWLRHVAGPPVGITTMRAWAEAGAFSWTGLGRARLCKELDAWETLTKGERKWIVGNVPAGNGLVAALRLAAKRRRDGGVCTSDDRVRIVASACDLLANNPSQDADYPAAIAVKEESLLGAAVTYTRLEGHDTSLATTTCRDFLQLTNNHGVHIIACEVMNVRSFKSRNGKTMAFVSVKDGTCGLDDVVVFSDEWTQFSSLLRPGRCVLITGERDPRRGSLKVNSVAAI